MQQMPYIRLTQKVVSTCRSCLTSAQRKQAWQWTAYLSRKKVLTTEQKCQLLIEADKALRSF